MQMGDKKRSRARGERRKLFSLVYLFFCRGKTRRKRTKRRKMPPCSLLVLCKCCLLFVCIFVSCFLCVCVYVCALNVIVICAVNCLTGIC